MNDENYNAVKSDFIMALRIIYHEGLSDAFAHLSARSDEGHEMMFMPRKSPALVERDELFFVDFEKPVPQSSLHQAIYKLRPDVKAVFHFHSPAVILLSVVGQSIRPMHNYSAIFYQGVPLYTGHGTGRISGAGRRNGQAAGRRQGAHAAGPWRRRGRPVDSRSLHAGAFLGRIGAVANRSHETRHAAIHGARRSREDSQTDLQAQLRRTGLGPFRGQMRQLNLSLPSSPVSV